ncbi:MAG: hypothetical protein JWO29_1233 [Arthrobacter sp.]|nr:hypothetical protein [Arthrobacter sp.]
MSTPTEAAGIATGSEAFAAPGPLPERQDLS